MSAHALYTQHQATVERVVKAVCARHRVSAPDAEDFASDFRLRLLEENCAALTRFEGRSSFQTYLSVVVTRAYLDWRNARWGKWRPSAEAKRLGPLALVLERLVLRDGLTLDEAHEVIQANLQVAVQRGELAAMVARFPVRRPRRLASEDELAELPGAGPSADAQLETAEARDEARNLAVLVRDAMSTLPPADQLLIRLRFANSLPMPEIARLLCAAPKLLYRRLDRLLLDLRSSLGRHGVTRDAVAALIACDGLETMSVWSRGEATNLDTAGKLPGASVQPNDVQPERPEDLPRA